MKLEVSIGEAIDKYSILELKYRKISDTNKQYEVQKELSILYECKEYIQKYRFFYQLLNYVNESIWDMTNIIKGKSPEDPEYAMISHQIFEFNQKRFRIKNWFNIVSCSNLKEQKSYSLSHCRIIITNEQTIYDKIPEIHFLSLEYDSISFETPYIDIIKRLFSIPTIDYNSDIDNNRVLLEDFLISENRHIFELPPIRYLAGGLLGDFLQSLSVVNENFISTGIKGIIYLSNNGDVFRYGLENTFHDTFSIISTQKYVKEYCIYNNQEYDISLSSWRDDLTQVLNDNPTFNWKHVYYHKYNVEWGSHKWLDLPYEEKWDNTIVINTTSYRWPHKVDFVKLNELYPNQIIFIGSDIQQFQFFINKTGLNIPFLEVSTFYQLCTIIHSCKLFVGSLSGPLSIAHACHKDRIIGVVSSSIDLQLNDNLTELWPNARYDL